MFEDITETEVDPVRKAAIEELSEKDLWMKELDCLFSQSVDMEIERDMWKERAQTMEAQANKWCKRYCELRKSTNKNIN